MQCPPRREQSGRRTKDETPIEFAHCSFARQFSKRAAGEAAEFSRSGVEFLSVIGTARLECDEPAAEAGELIRRQLGNSFGNFFDFHVAQYSTAGALLSDGKGLAACLLGERAYLLTRGE
jgi:hypothetical protein